MSQTRPGAATLPPRTRATNPKGTVMADQPKASSTEKTAAEQQKAAVAAANDRTEYDPTAPVVVSNTGLTLEEAEKLRNDSLEEKAKEGEEWHPASGTGGGGVHTDAVVIHNPDIDAPVVVTKGQRVAFESEDYKVKRAPDPGA